MSYDGWIEIYDLNDRLAPAVIAEIGNYTSNVARMWRWCLSMVCESDVSLRDTDGWTCDRAAPILTKAATVMERNRGRLSEWNPSNGWGDYDGALNYLRDAANTARRFRSVPDATLRWCS